MARGSVVLIAIVIGAAGALIAVAFTPPPPPDDLRPPRSARSVPASVEQFEDAREVELVASAAPAIALGAPVDGVLTRYTCVVGQTIVSGTSPFAINGRPVLALYSATPFWRDLSPGDVAGDDLVGLRAELARLGFPVGTGGRFDRQTAASYVALAERVGIPKTPDRAFLLTDVVWLPTPAVVVDSCDSFAGATVGRGGPLSTLRSDLEGARLKVVPDGMVAGQRVVDLGGTRVAVDDAGQVVSDGLTALRDSAAYRSWLASDGAVPLAGRLVLSSALEVWSVPPSAVITDGSSACVYSGRDKVAVIVVASRLGQSLVTAEDGLPAQVTAEPLQDSC